MTGQPYVVRIKHDVVSNVLGLRSQIRNENYKLSKSLPTPLHFDLQGKSEITIDCDVPINIAGAKFTK